MFVLPSSFYSQQLLLDLCGKYSVIMLRRCKNVIQAINLVDFSSFLSFTFVKTITCAAIVALVLQRINYDFSTVFFVL